jgi:CheY-like chemotaxis protein
MNDRRQGDAKQASLDKQEITMGDKAPILVTDDSPTICMMLSAALQPLKYPIVIAPNGMATVRLAMQNRPALCILDIELGAGDCKGDSIARAIVEQNIPVLLYSTLSPEKLQALAKSLGCEWHCKVGTSLLLVREHVRKIIEGHHHGK